MKKIIYLISTALILIGCNHSTEILSNTNNQIKRDLNPKVDNKDLDSLIKSNNSFAFDIFNKLLDNNNLIISPISISSALYMLYPASKTETKDEIKRVLRVDIDDKSIPKTFNKLDLLLESKMDSYRFKIANSIWPSKEFIVKKSYQDTIMKNFGAKLQTLDYINFPQKSRDIINSWIEKNTEGKIVDLLPPNSITPFTKMVITNSIYLNGEWDIQFDKNRTKKDIFNNKNYIDFIYQNEIFAYFEDSNLKAIKLDYKYKKSSMIVILPKDNQTLLLNQSYFDKIYKSFKRYRVNLKMPKFKLTSQSISLKDSLIELGMVNSFDRYRADFSNLSDENGIFIDDIVHKTFIDVNEYGTEAAAATAIMIKVTGVEIAKSVDLSIDKPFIFIIVDNETKEILFLGYIKDL